MTSIDPIAGMGLHMHDMFSAAALLLLFFAVGLCAQAHDPNPNGDAIVQRGNARFTILTPRVVRMEWAEDGVFEDRTSLVFIDRNVETPSFTHDEEDGWLMIRTDALELRYKIGSGRFSADNLEIRFNTGGIEGSWRPGMESDGNLRGTLRTLDGFDGDYNTYTEKKVELEPGLLSRDGWVLVDDTGRPVFDDSEWPWVTARGEKEHQDFYFFAYGRDYKAALGDFVSIAGRIPLPPRYVFGNWFSRWRAFSELELRALVDRFESLDVPLDVLVVDMDWHLTSLPEFFADGERIKDQADESAGWTGFTWNRDFFPDPKEFLQWAGGKGLRTCLNLHPASGFQPHEEKYEAMARAMGIDPATKQYVPFAITDKNFARNYFDLVLHPMEEDGVDFWWLDWQQWDTTAIPGVNPIFYLNYVHFTDMERREGVRPLIYHRWGGLGNHRYQVGFSGDTRTTWASLDFQPYFTATAANVGFGYWSHDIGGFYGEPNTPENFTRWFQLGVFSPILKTHATSGDFNILRRIWLYPHETFVHLRDLVHLRYQLIPYIYTAARRAYDTGVSICHPMYYDYPDRDEAYQFENEYMFGDDLLVHPITHPMEEGGVVVVQQTWLPEGEWFEWFSGAVLEGGRVVERPFMIDEVPVYAKAGAIVPMQPKMLHTGEKPVDPLILSIFPGERGSVRVYEDEGNTDGYLSGRFSYTPVSFEREGTSMKIAIEPIEGEFPGMLESRAYELRLPNTFPPVKVSIDGAALDFNPGGGDGCWHYDGQTLTTRVFVPRGDVSVRKVISIEFPQADAALLSGKKRQLAVLYKLAVFLADTRNYWRQTKWSDAKYSSDLVMHTVHTGLRIGRDPSTAAAELKEFDSNYGKIVAMLEQLSQEVDIYAPYLDLLKAAK